MYVLTRAFIEKVPLHFCWNPPNRWHRGRGRCRFAPPAAGPVRRPAWAAAARSRSSGSRRAAWASSPPAYAVPAAVPPAWRYGYFQRRSSENYLPSRFTFLPFFLFPGSSAGKRSARRRSLEVFSQNLFVCAPHKVPPHRTVKARADPARQRKEQKQHAGKDTGQRAFPVQPGHFSVVGLHIPDRRLPFFLFPAPKAGRFPAVPAAGDPIPKERAQQATDRPDGSFHYPDIPSAFCLISRAYSHSANRDLL